MLFENTKHRLALFFKTSPCCFLGVLEDGGLTTFFTMCRGLIKISRPMVEVI